MTQISCSSMKDVVNFAIDREKWARDFYQYCKENSKKPGLKSFFEEMAQEEEKHRQLLLELDLSDVGDFSSEEMESLKLSDYMVDVQFTPEMTFQEALVMAMKKEEKAHAFYVAWQNRCSHEKTADVFNFLAGEELKHKRKIEDLYESEVLQGN